ncbi:S41 family peptidase [Sporosarcina thermotolerans]|uniref:S41 family peptidase n=1 Tax=Sporosarcina thermotolerans TaxID=633404 RepID=A0AAW9A533_9BACL|nr:S41 family peptidase [Sporosarcina thermotolerans]MDW0116077.1 S41 family peptidase [Sporosarcina thermotolerans]WHT48047.1 S41 family peptidase [Sporosarcina thermotolerans]
MIKRPMKPLIALLTLLFVMMPFTQAAAAEPLDAIRQLIQEYYVDEVPDDVLLKESAKEIVDGLDPHSIYMTKQEYEAFINGIEQRIVGIGVVLEESDKGVKVISVIKDGPAFKSGLLPGDVITRVNGISLTGKSVQAVVPLIGGEENTSVTLTIERGNSLPITKTIKRAEIHLPTVESEMLGGNIGYIRLNSFATNSAKEMAEAINTLGDTDGLILDIRNNGGGYITAAQEIAGFFPNVSQAFQIREKNKTPAIYRSVNQEIKIKSPVSLLINEYSASASEMLAVNLKEQNAAKIFGQTSYGKGTAQSMFAFQDGSVLKLTTARFFSPKGIAVDKVGVTPDVVTATNEEVNTAHYDQLLYKFAGYSPFPVMENVKTTKTFTIRMSKDMDWSRLDERAIQLIELGGEEAEVRVAVKDGRTVEVTPVSPMISGKDYLLVVHPLWKDKSGVMMGNGIYLKVVVE